MTLPGWRDWAFALKTYAAAMLALFVALWIDLPRPYWAVGTVYITSQVLSGATRAKAVYRVGGTVLGAAVSVVLVPNLVNEPILLSLAVALWVALCLYVSLLDRTPASYLPMLAGYTAALIGFPAVEDPGAIFDTAVARAEEISLGILCASLAATLILPQSAAPLIVGRLNLWLAEARAWIQGALAAARAPEASGTSQGRRLRLASDALGLDALGLALRNEATGAERAAEAFAPVRQHMLMVLPIVAAVADRVETLERAGALPARVRSFLSDLAVWLADEADDPERAAHLRGRIDGFEPTLGRNPDWTTLLLASLAARLRDVIDLRQDLRALRGHLAAGTPPRAPLAFAYTARVRSIRHRDHGLAAFSAFGVFVGLLVCCAIWIATGWPDGSAAPMMGAVACCLFAAQDDPAPQILSFTNSALVGALGAGLYLFAVLPLATSFEMLALALAPALILCGLMMTQPRTAPMGMGAALNGATLLALQNGYSGDFAPFANGVIASVVGMWVGAVVTRLIRSVGAGWSARRLVRINRQSLAAAADGRGTGHGLELAALMLDRIGLIAPRLATLPAETSASVGDLLADVRVGINLVEVRRVRRRLTGPPRTAVDRALALAARQLRDRTGRPDSALLAALDDGLDAVADAAPGPERRAALIGLTGLRRGLFPDAPAYRAAPPARDDREMAA
ncbi:MULTISPECIES: FUSC family protein [Methylobacterium]|uniref:Fusaric acid resistance protein region n=1 Tax=Methylobacterium oryzae CBMB20 TaxID=693986 RepID=A0A089NXP7_9HYPH|nr:MULTISPECIES: FUSC family protein [Methylobacterium]AIQ90598.1 Fusaric acid resistance protein region [Methylobacterium oryzae CBMB20]AWV17283.1 fusaric acid resistance protein [Methylobacterium sp. XJLW]WFS10305.1 FUSC family protein [Methylobacterium sp. 391_Methyba4]